MPPRCRFRANFADLSGRVEAALLNPLGAANSLPNVNPVPPLNRAHYPKVKYWDRETWANFCRQNQHSKGDSQDTGVRGGTRCTQDINVAARYIQYSDGSVVSGQRAAAMRRSLDTLFAEIHSKGASKPSFKKLSAGVLAYIHHHMELSYEELRYCSNHWKTDVLGSDRYSPWYNQNVRKPALAAVKEEPLGAESTDTDMTTRKHSHDVSSDTVPASKKARSSSKSATSATYALLVVDDNNNGNTSSDISADPQPLHFDVSDTFEAIDEGPPSLDEQDPQNASSETVDSRGKLGLTAGDGSDTRNTNKYGTLVELARVVSGVPRAILEPSMAVSMEAPVRLPEVPENDTNSCEPRPNHLAASPTTKNASSETVDSRGKLGLTAGDGSDTRNTDKSGALVELARVVSGAPRAVLEPSMGVPVHAPSRLPEIPKQAPIALLKITGPFASMPTPKALANTLQTASTGGTVMLASNTTANAPVVASTSPSASTSPAISTLPGASGPSALVATSAKGVWQRTTTLLTPRRVSQAYSFLSLLTCHNRNLFAKHYIEHHGKSLREDVEAAWVALGLAGQKEWGGKSKAAKLKTTAKPTATAIS
ncbi:hypothetical protein PUNSTDRAFT_47463 [Punctularia strigosozonata HHB-11173 SS5]|uniref:Uncharacterized protein n=1 Tax=Punctularia strigosozonata (strain HHB-11173) TaxID=741275 RepID=R7S3W0_PUNST|nr:uncharacterized protein PUNSTDRAFT_47463 [Punctularia strigosozonata HHB-11173 SS5]EIN04487.1 hypothetical protein PUNSTDRAFT_47463 [Punctularia strigosozonata HHB-11173 SS5]